jgi:O-antigen/teichoic acid export membrane protein
MASPTSLGALRPEVLGVAPPDAEARSRAAAGVGASLRRNVGWALGGRVVYGATQFALLVVLARLGDVTAVGAFAFALAYIAPAMVFANLQLRSLYATDVDDRFAWSKYVALRRRATVLATALILASLLVVPASSDVAWATAWITLAKAFETCSDLHYGVFQRHGRMEHFGRSLAARGVVGVAVVAIVLAAGGSMPWAMAAMAAWWGLLLVAHDAPIAARLRPVTGTTSSPGTVGQLAWQAAPMGLVFLLDSLHQNIPRYLVEAELGTAMLGLFTPMVYMITIGSAFVFALGAPAAPVLARFAADRDADGFARLARRIIGRGAALGAVGVVATVVAGRPLLAVAYGPEYAAQADAFVFVATGGALHFTMVPTILGLTAARSLRVQPLVYVAAIAVATTTCVLLVPTHGLVGAAIAGAAGMAAGTLVATVLLGRVIAVMRRDRGGHRP